MKRIYPFIMIMGLLTLVSSVGAQSRIGVIGGLNFSTMEPTADEEIVGYTVMGIGGVFSYRMFESVSFQIEPMYLQKFAGIEAAENQPAVDTELTFLEVPLLARYDFGKTVQPYLIAGPSFGYLLKSELKTNAGGFGATADPKETLKALDIGISAGAGVDIPLGPLFLFLESRYTWGLQDLNKGGIVEFSAGAIKMPVEIDENDVMKNRGLQLMVGVLLPL